MYLSGSEAGFAFGSRINEPIGVEGAESSEEGDGDLGDERLSIIPDRTATPIVPHPSTHN